MPFQKGRKKTGGRVKGGPRARATKFIDQLARHGFNFAREFAGALKALPEASKYAELKSLLPFMAPKLKEREVELVDLDPQVRVLPTDNKISDEALIKALSNEPTKQSKPKSNSESDLLQGAPKGTPSSGRKMEAEESSEGESRPETVV